MIERPLQREFFESCLEGRTADAAHILDSHLADIDADSKADSGDISRALLAAAEGDHIDTCRMLLDRGAKIDEPMRRSPLQAAARHGHSEVCKLLMERGADTEFVGECGDTPLLLAAENGHGMICKMLLNHGAKIGAVTAENTTVLHFAATNAWGASFCAGLVQRGADPHATDNLGRTSLHACASHGDAKTCEALIDLGLDIHARDLEGRTPLDCSIAALSVDVCSVLVSKGANPVGCKVDEKYESVDLFLWDRSSIDSMSRTDVVAQVLCLSRLEAAAARGNSKTLLEALELEGDVDENTGVPKRSAVFISMGLREIRDMPRSECESGNLSDRCLAAARIAEENGRVESAGIIRTWLAAKTARKAIQAIESLVEDGRADREFTAVVRP